MSLSGTIALDRLQEWMVGQRWFASKSRELSGLGILEAITLRDDDPALELLLVSAKQAAGAHDLYQVPIGVRPRAGGWTAGVIWEDADHTFYDALVDPALAEVLLDQILSGGSMGTEEDALVFDAIDGISAPVADARPIGVEQSNTSVVFGDELVLKVFRRLEPGMNPELELLRFLQDRGFESIAPLAGWYQYKGRLVDSTLGVLQRYLPGTRDGWTVALQEAPEAPARFIQRLGELGVITGRMHTVLASDGSDPAMAPEEPSPEMAGLIVATVDDEIEAVFAALPDDPRLDPIVGRQQDMREKLLQLSQVGLGGRLIRNHGDYHLGQVLLDGDRWVIVDFEGEPSRPLALRRQKRSPLRDVAGMLRSFAYVASTVEMEGGALPGGWELQARAAFLDGYLGAVEPSLLPAGRDPIDKLLTVFELEKSLYELRYELDNRPDWVPIPVGSISRLLDDDR